MTAHTDVLVIGAGSAGCVVARRLLESGQTVRVVEAGGADTNPNIDDVSRLGLLWGAEEDWNYFTEPEPELNSRRVHLPRGKVLGGSHALNATIWVRGDRRDFDAWAASGCEGWAWEDVLPYFRAIEAFPEGDPAVRGDQGLLDVTLDYPRHPIQESLYEATVEEGVPENSDYNGGDVAGVGWMQLNLRDGIRFNTWRAYLKPLADHPGLDLRPRTHTRRLLVSGTRVLGAECEQDGQIHRFTADEVVLCAGALGSPEILLRSGIGPADHLRQVGVQTAVDLPGVGRNLHDHLLAPVVCTTERRMPPPEVAATQVHFWDTSPAGAEVPDTQPIFFSVPMYTNTAGVLMEGPEEGVSLLAGIVRPASRGSLTLSGPGPEDPVRIRLGAYSEAADLEAMLYSLRQCRSIAAQPALAAWGAEEIFPGPDVGDSEEALVEYIRNTTTTYHHQVGTCAMGTGEAAVVDPVSLRVHGVEGLRVADASIMPQVTSGNTNAPSVLIGEKAAAAITGRKPF